MMSLRASGSIICQHQKQARQLVQMIYNVVRRTFPTMKLQDLFTFLDTRRVFNASQLFEFLNSFPRKQQRNEEEGENATDDDTTNNNNMKMKNRSIVRTAEIMRLITGQNDPISNNHITVQSLLDIGGADGSITAALAEQFSLTKEQTFVLDIHPAANDKVTNVPYDMVNAPGKIPLKDQSIDMVLLMVSLHHIRHKNTTLAEIYRVLKPGGMVIVREHDVHQREYALMDALDIIHWVYDYINQEGHLHEYYSNYFDFKQLQRMMEEHHFTFVRRMDPYQKYNPQRLYYALLLKPAA